MDKDYKMIQEWSNTYYKILYMYVRRICRKSSDTEDIIYQTLTLAYKNRRKLKRELKHENEWRDWMLQTVRYFLLKKIYEEWERGVDVHGKYVLPDSVDFKHMKAIVDLYQVKKG